MKTIVIIENKKTGFGPLAHLFQQWQQKINILTVSKESAATNILSEKQVDLFICDLTIPTNNGLEGFGKIAHSFPYIPCITLTDRQNSKPEKAIELGAGYCLEKPIDTDNFLHHAQKLLERGERSTVKGIPIHSFLQMLESEKKTCTLQVTRKNDRGMFYIREGVLINAETKSLAGEEAAFLILTWEETVIEIRYFNGQRRQQIHKPLITIIVEAFRLRSERNKLRKIAAPATQHQLPLVHLSTRENSISLKNGGELKIEVPHIQVPLESRMVGMFENQFLIITTPPSFSSKEKMIGSDHRIIIRYIQEGKIWMFKSRLLKAIDSPTGLLFLEYPEVIHYHELRQTKRTAIFVPCTFHQRAEPELYGALIDLSTNGGLCQIKNGSDTTIPNIDVNNRIQLRCLLPGTKEEQKIDGIVRNLKKDGSSTRIGIEFEYLQPHLIETISKYIYSVDDTAGGL
jgi:DNA-binding NarL/FixJ family response regulator/c-di-GMP-binding flagellar brake protein YcgR